MAAFGDVPIFVDVGASDGRVCRNWIDRVKVGHVYAFEPCPNNFKNLKKKTATYANFHIYPYAVSSKDQKEVNFYLSNQDNYSSLCKHNDDAIRKWKYPPGRRLFRNFPPIKVKSIRLDKFLRENRIKFVDYMKINARGHDLEVLKGLGRSIVNVRELVVNVSLTDFDLYEGQTNQKEKVVDFLVNKGFKLRRTDPISKHQEENLYFLSTRFARLEKNLFYQFPIPY